MSKLQMMDFQVHTTSVAWRPLGPGTAYKLLRVSAETGVWSAILKMEKGAVFAPHKHLGAAEVFILQGRTQDRVGIQETGDYLYEPIGVEHAATSALEDSLIHFTAHGPIAFFNESGGIGMVLDWEFFASDAARDPQLSYKEAA